MKKARRKAKKEKAKKEKMKKEKAKESRMKRRKRTASITQVMFKETFVLHFKTGKEASRAAGKAYGKGKHHDAEKEDGIYHTSHVQRNICFAVSDWKGSWPCSWQGQSVTLSGGRGRHLSQKSCLKKHLFLHFKKIMSALILSGNQ